MDKKADEIAAIVNDVMRKMSIASFSKEEAFMCPPGTRLIVLDFVRTNLTLDLPQALDENGRD